MKKILIAGSILSLLLMLGLNEGGGEPTQEPPVEPEPVGGYVPKYFKDKEYFGNWGTDHSYYPNWLRLAEQLDKIREKLGSPVIITKGYTEVIGESYNGFNRATWVQIRSNNMGLYEVVRQMLRSGEITFYQVGKVGNEVFLKLEK